MNTHANKAQENKNLSVAYAALQKQSMGESAFLFVNNRSEAVVQSKLQEMMSNSPQVQKLRALQKKANTSPHANQATHLQAIADNHSAQKQQPIQKKENNTGLPDNLKTGVESISGISLDDVKVHRNSDKPAQLQAHAYAQGTDIHLGDGQEKHLPHEVWHVVQQMRGRVQPTMQIKGVSINDDPALEREADLMGMEATSRKSPSRFPPPQGKSVTNAGGLHSLAVSSAGKPLLGRGLAHVVQRLTIDLDLREGDDGTTRLGNVVIEGRAPTSGDGGQGDHTVSSSLINLGLKSQLFGQDMEKARINLENAFNLLNHSIPAEGHVSATRMM